MLFGTQKLVFGKIVPSVFNNLCLRLIIDSIRITLCVPGLTLALHKDTRLIVLP